MSKHTPGPWEVEFSAGGPYIQCKTLLIATACACDQAGDEFCDGDVTAANARLIAAAPDLLAALKDLERTAGQAAMFDDPVRVAARAAIKRAEVEGS